MPPLLPEGSRLRGRYKIVRVLSATRLRNMYLAEDQHLKGKHWVIRQMQPVGIDSGDRKWLLSQFEAEARLLSTLEHGCLPKIVDFFVQDLYLYVIREFVPGLDLNVILQQRSGRLSERDSLSIGYSLIELMTYLLKKKLPPIVFRELSLANLVYTPDGQTKLIDFGFSRLFQREARLGAPDYAAPEQYAEDAEVDGQTLVYNVGALMYHLMTGHNPGTTPFSLPPIQHHNPGISDKTVNLIEKATENNRQQRFASLGDLGKAIQQLLTSKPAKSAKKKGGTQRLEQIPLPGGGSFRVEGKSGGGGFPWGVVFLLLLLGAGGAVALRYLGLL
ncbi:protein kinase [bacterium]|nr:protein kinase [bacterium]